jgi:hypothetical protein
VPTCGRQGRLPYAFYDTIAFEHPRKYACLDLYKTLFSFWTKESGVSPQEISKNHPDEFEE